MNVDGSEPTNVMLLNTHVLSDVRPTNVSVGTTTVLLHKDVERYVRLGRFHVVGMVGDVEMLLKYSCVTDSPAQ